MDILSKQESRLYLTDTEIIGGYKNYFLSGQNVVELEKNSAAIFNVNFPKDGYYEFRIKRKKGVRNNLHRIECLLDDRILGTTYFTNSKSNMVTFGIQFVSKGCHKVELRSMFEPCEPVEYISIRLTNRTVEPPLFSFMVISDTHIHEKNPSGKYLTREKFLGRIPIIGKVGLQEFPVYWINRLLWKKIPDIVKTVVDDINRLKPEFVIHNGDISGEKKNFLSHAKSIFDRLNCPYYIVRGNHDRRQYLLDIFNMGNSYYSFDFRRFHFIMIDSSYYRYGGKCYPDFLDSKSPDGITIPDKELIWLENDIKKHGNMITLLFMHQPLVIERYPNIILADGQTEPYSVMRHSDYQKILKLLDRYANLRAVFTGHGHINEISERNNLWHIQTGSLIEYPMTYRQVVIFSSHIEVRSYQISDKSYPEESFLTTPDNIFKRSNNGWVIGRNKDLHNEIKIEF